MESFERNINSKTKFEKAVLIGLVYGEQTEDQLIEYMDELEFLTNTAGAKVLKRFTQKLPHPDVRSFVGKGKLEEIQEYVALKEIDLVIFDDEISPKQQSHIEEALKVKVLDRSNLILDIFAKWKWHNYNTFYLVCVVCGHTWKDNKVVLEQGGRVKRKLKQTGG